MGFCTTAVENSAEKNFIVQLNINDETNENVQNLKIFYFIPLFPKVCNVCFRNEMGGQTLSKADRF